jgi:hypothetical protein
MSWTIAGKYVRASATDPDAQAYLQAVEAADGQALEFEVARAIDNFVLGCKADGIWSAIKASCILAGARTRLGALTPLVGTAPTSFNFVDGDYNRKTGLVGDGSTKYLNSNRLGTADPQNSFHQAVWRTASETRTATRGLMGYATGNSDQLLATTTARFFRNRTNFVSISIADTTALAGIFAHSRSSGDTVTGRYAGSNYTFTPFSSDAGIASDILVYRRAADYADARLAFYSIGESRSPFDADHAGERHRRRDPLSTVVAVSNHPH